MKQFDRIPGIIGFMGEPCDFIQGLHEKFASTFFCCHKEASELVSSRIETPFGVAGLLNRNVDDNTRSKNAASNGCYAVLFEGEFFSKDGRREGADWLIELITENGINGLNDLNGNYMVAVYDIKKRLFILRSDRYASRLLYYSNVNGVLVFAGDFRYVLRPQPRKNSINYEAIIDFIDLEFILNNETFHSEIKVLGHGEQLTWDGYALISERYWDYPLALPCSSRAQPEEFVLETHHKINRAISLRIEGKPSIGVTLSSGIDSRAIAAYAASMRHEPLPCYHLGQPGHRNSRWAADICRTIGGNLESVALSDLEFDKLLNNTFKLLAGQVSLNQANILWLLSSKDVQNSYILDGQVQDSLLGIYAYITIDPQSNISPDSYADEILKQHNPMHPDMLRMILKERLAQEAISRRKQRINQHLQKRIFGDNTALTQWFYYTARGQRYVWGAPVLEFSLADVGLPGMDYDLFDWAMGIPVELRGVEAKIYRSILCEYFPDVARIPRDSTGTSLYVYRGLIKKNYSITGKEYWCHVIRRLTNGKIDLSDRYHDYNKIFRCNKEFRNSFLKPACCIENVSESPISVDAVARLTKMIMEGRNYFEGLQRVITVLNYFQHCAD